MQHMPELVFDTCVLSNFALADAFHVLERLYRGASWVTSYVSSGFYVNLNNRFHAHCHFVMQHVIGLAHPEWPRRFFPSHRAS